MDKIKTENLRLAKIKYYDTVHNGVEVSDLDAYVFLVQVGENQFLNLKKLPKQEKILQLFMKK